MKTVSAEQRFVNILQRAITLGFHIIPTESFEDTIFEAEAFLVAKTEAVDVECKNVGVDYADYTDGKGYAWSISGDVVDFSEHSHDWPGTKIVFATVVNSDAQVLNLYYLVGETHNREVIS